MKALLTLLLMMSMLTSFAQSELSIPTSNIDLKNGHGNDWEIYVATLDYKIEYKFVNCDPSIGYDKEMVLLRFTNRSREQMTFDWHMKLYYDGACKTCDYFDEYHYVVKVMPESEKEGSCDIYSDYQLKIFSKFNDEKYTLGDVLTGFHLDQLTLTTQP